MGDSKDGRPRLMEPRRDQVEWRAYDVDGLIPKDHRARILWDAVTKLDLSEFLDLVGAREHSVGRPALDPRMLLTLWLFATSEGVGSARHLARLCTRDHAYMWICGGLTPNHHSLAEFRVEHGDKLDQLLTQILAALMAEKLLRLKRVAQDGIRVRANAGAASFRRGASLAESYEKARAQVAALRKELETDPAASQDRERQSDLRDAERRATSLERAMKLIPKATEAHARTKRSRSPSSKKPPSTEPRVSTTDPEARVQKMGDGGFRPAFNLQFATDTETRLIVGVGITNRGVDSNQMPPMYDQVRRRLGVTPRDYLVDGGFASLAAIDYVEQEGTRVFAPLQKARNPKIDPHARKKEDTDHTARWRRRMKTSSAKKIYRERGAVAETVHADARRWRGLQQLPCRGAQKGLAVALLHALTYNVMRAVTVRAEAKALKALRK
jgi:transposase